MIQIAADTPTGKILNFLEKESDLKRGCKRLSEVLQIEISFYNADKEPLEILTTAPTQASIFPQAISVISKDGLPGLLYKRKLVAIFAEGKELYCSKFKSFSLDSALRDTANEPHKKIFAPPAEIASITTLNQELIKKLEEIQVKNQNTEKIIGNLLNSIGDLFSDFSNVCQKNIFPDSIETNLKNISENLQNSGNYIENTFLKESLRKCSEGLLGIQASKIKELTEAIIKEKLHPLDQFPIPPIPSFLPKTLRMCHSASGEACPCCGNTILPGSEFRLSSCNHLFHKTCLSAQWERLSLQGMLKDQLKCVSCNKPINPSDIANVSEIAMQKFIENETIFRSQQNIMNPIIGNGCGHCGKDIPMQKMRSLTCEHKCCEECLKMYKYFSK